MKELDPNEAIREMQQDRPIQLERTLTAISKIEEQMRNEYTHEVTLPRPMSAFIGFDSTFDKQTSLKVMKAFANRVAWEMATELSEGELAHTIFEAHKV